MLLSLFNVQNLAFSRFTFMSFSEVFDIKKFGFNSQ